MHADCIETQRSKKLQSIKERLSLRSKLKLRERERESNWLMFIHAKRALIMSRNWKNYNGRSLLKLDRAHARNKDMELLKVEHMHETMICN